MTGHRYLSSDHLQGFNKYKYSCRETSPLALYIILPLWNKLVKLVPLWMAPNVLTFTGWLLLMFNFWLLAYYDWDFNTSTSDREDLHRQPIPAAVWLYCGVAHFLSYILDGLDGKQARRTGSSTPLGELFDHGCDSWATILLPMGLMSSIGRGSKWGGSPHDAVIPCLSLVGGFYMSHWEKYITGCLYIPWIYDVIQLGCGAAYIATGIFGVEVWHFYVFSDWTFAMTLKWALILGFLSSIPTSLWNIYQHYQTCSPPEEQNSTAPSPSPNPAPRQLSFLQCLSPLLPFLMFCALYLIWVTTSPSDIMEREPRILLFTVGVVFSNIACRLIISQMTGQPAEVFNYLLIPLSIAVVTPLLVPRYEMVILFIYFAMVLVAHLHYVISVVEELSEHFHIYVFSLAKRESTS